ncbi:hypothetical protein L207DRAFT_561140 [Hyaloscypha variabilis F]|uniref:EGF-like domain-containing protein n=1 Tax=Hyaloscypha variabilis (strain UAMH 11265 / GT02V1 / F) TaxID=1149755 RepID=A0A2J6SAB5_HYAVF|nr:hypothetical protein L207DRAFT_561140 [Hyaloscypha variabilis F]
MLFFKSALTLSALLMVASAFTVERIVPAHNQAPVKISSHAVVSKVKVPAFSALKSDCEKEDEDDCTEFCSLLEQTSTCAANGNKVTCYCKGGKSESNCEERCLLCMPDKTAFEEASRLFKVGGSKNEEL